MKKNNEKNNSNLFLQKTILLILMVLFISGCDGRGRNAVTDADYHTGTEGINLRFLNDVPPSKIYDGDSLDVMLEITNRGVADVTHGRIYLTGYDPKYIQLSPSEDTITIEGKSIFNPDGKLMEIKTFVDGIVEVPRGADSLTQSIKATACYKYNTEAFTSVCIDPNPRSTGTKVCTPGLISLSGGQGGPIAVTTIEQETGRDRVTFKINFVNLGGGTVFDIHKGITNCHTDLEYQDIDIVTVNAQLSDKTLQCEPNGGNDVRIVDGKGFVYCYYNGNLGNDAYSTQMSIDIDYAYRSSITRGIEIVNI